MKTEAWLNARLFFVPFFNPGENENDGENENKSVPRSLFPRLEAKPAALLSAEEELGKCPKLWRRVCVGT